MIGESFDFAGERLWLDPRRAVWWPRAKTLFVADLHLGKARMLRERGIPVPEGTTAADLERLAALLTDWGAERLLILGDFAHGRPTEEQRWPEFWLRFRRRHAALEVAAVRGNHDRRLDLSALAVTDLGAAADLGPFRAVHAASENEAPCLAGHLHPCARLAAGRRTLRLPCLWLRHDQAVLPAFTALAGGQPVEPKAGERLLVCLTDRILPWPPRGPGRAPP
jgi:DNA ligase-associated metallophosphoesterase